MNITMGNDSFDIYPLQLGAMMPRAAIYTIWTYNPQNNNYPLLYVGQTGDLGERLDRNHHKFQCWTTHQIQGLYVGVRLMPSERFDREQRRAEEQRLINAYRPVCNKQNLNLASLFSSS